MIMGLLVDGRWQDTWYDTQKSQGKFERQGAMFRHDIGHNSPFKPEAGRYHLYVSLACPWAHRTLIMRSLKQLETIIPVSIVSPDMLDNGWQFGGYPGATTDPIYQSHYLHQLYTRADPHISSRVTVPVLWDSQQHTIVNNESADIMRIFNRAFNHMTGNQDDYYPLALRKDIDIINEVIYHKINNGVYKAGFATTQEAYEDAVRGVFSALDEVAVILRERRYLLGEQVTEADWRLFTTLIRFDPVYVGHFKCHLKRIIDYPEIDNYMRELYQMEGIAQTVNFDHIKRHYYFSHTMINPTQVVPVGPIQDLWKQHNRGHL
jgi:putative glutathione S-transferase